MNWNLNLILRKRKSGVHTENKMSASELMVNFQFSCTKLDMQLHNFSRFWGFQLHTYQRATCLKFQLATCCLKFQLVKTNSQLVVYKQITCNSLFKISTRNLLFKISTRENQLATRCLKFQLVKTNSQLVVYKQITCNLLFICSTRNLQLATCNLQFTISRPVIVNIPYPLKLT